MLETIRRLRGAEPRPAAGGALTAVFSALTGLCLAGASRLITSQSIRQTLSAVLGESALFFGEAAFFALIVFALAQLFRSIFASGCAVSAMALLISLTHHFKLLITSTPLEVQDFALIGAAGDIAQLNAQYISLSRNSALAIIGTALWLCVLFIASKPLRLPKKQRWISFAASCALFALVFCLGADAIIYSPLDVPLSRSYRQRYVNSHTGFVLGLWRSAIYRDSGMEYNEKTAAEVASELGELIAAIPAGGDGEPVNVIMVLSESFFDVTELPGVEYEGDPVADFHALQAEGVSGKFYTRTLGYGTVNIELELLTGINTRLMPYGEALNTWTAERFTQLPALPQVLGDAGYYTAFLHMYNDSIYNRRAFLPGLGFDEVFFSEDMAKIDPEAAAAGDDYWDFMEERISGWFYSDDYMADLVAELFSQKKDEQPVFIYAVSMENHSTYTADKYGEYDFPFEAEISDEARGALSAATQGVANASRSLRKLTDYLETVDEPTVLIFFGDHKPGLGLEQGGSVYTELGMCTADSSQWTAEQSAEMYSADYLIWANDPELLPAEPGTRADDSSNYLGLTALECSGTQLPDYWRALAALRQESIVYTWNYFISDEGAVSLQLPETETAAQRRADLFGFLLRDAYASRYLEGELY